MELDEDDDEDDNEGLGRFGGDIVSFAWYFRVVLQGIAGFRLEVSEGNRKRNCLQAKRSSFGCSLILASSGPLGALSGALAGLMG